MKKIYFLLGLISYQGYSQDFANNTTTYDRTNISSEKKSIDIQPTVLLNKNGSYVKAYLNNLPSAIMADFVKSYEDAEDVTWKIDDNDVTGYFTYKGQKV